MEMLVKHSKYSHQIVYVHGRPDYVRIRLNICDYGFKEVLLYNLPKSVPLYRDFLSLQELSMFMNVRFSNRLSFKLRNVL